MGGKTQAYVAWTTAASGCRTGRAGPWRGHKYIELNKIRVLESYLPAADVFVATGFRAPRVECIVPDDIANVVWRVARGRPLTDSDRAIEGSATEARSRYRNQRLRELALAGAGGKCEGCRKDFYRHARGLGRRCLVVHHKKQLRDTDELVETRVADLAVLCANCHMIVHADTRRALTIAELRKKLSR